MTGLPPYWGVAAKIGRAALHLNELCTDVREHIDAYAPAVFVYREQQSPWRIGGIRSVDFPVLNWGIILGDIAHNLRSALDHLVFELSMATGSDPDRERTQFPIFYREDGYFGKRDSMLAGVPEPVRRLIDDVQPFHPDPPDLPPHEQGIPHPLRVLAAINNRDKHRIVKVASACFTSLPCPEVAPRNRGVTVDLRRFPTAIEREHGAEFFKFRTLPDANAEVDVEVIADKPRVTFDVDGLALDDESIATLIELVTEIAIDTLRVLE